MFADTGIISNQLVSLNLTGDDSPGQGPGRLVAADLTRASPLEVELKGL